MKKCKKNTPLISKQAGEELRRLSSSKKLRDELRIIRENSLCFHKKLSVGAYIDFLTSCNLFVKHQTKRFRRIEGKHFRI